MTAVLRTAFPTAGGLPLVVGSNPRRFAAIEIYGGEGGIRTHETVSGLTVFETVLINHSSTSPAVGEAHGSGIRARLSADRGERRTRPEPRRRITGWDTSGWPSSWPSS